MPAKIRLTVMYGYTRAAVLRPYGGIYLQRNLVALYPYHWERPCSEGAIPDMPQAGPATSKFHLRCSCSMSPPPAKKLAPAYSSLSVYEALLTLHTATMKYQSRTIECTHVLLPTIHVGDADPTKPATRPVLPAARVPFPQDLHMRRLGRHGARVHKGASFPPSEHPTVSPHTSLQNLVYST
jgi:hypothetical protein